MRTADILHWILVQQFRFFPRFHGTIIIRYPQRFRSTGGPWTLQASLPNIRAIFSGKEPGVNGSSIFFTAASYRINLDGPISRNGAFEVGATVNLFRQQ